MNGNCHFIVGACTGVAAAIILETDAAGTTLLVSTCLIGSIFPDIDNPQSHVGQLTAPVSTVIGKLSALNGHVGSNHRGILHDLALYILLLILAVRHCNYLAGFVYGAMSHLFLDALNPKGIPFLIKLRIRIGNIKSGGAGSIIASWLIAICIVAGCWLYKKYTLG